MNVVEKEFNALASEYEENRLADWYQAHAQEILKHCSMLEAGDVLDVGCGTGHFLRAYARDNPGVRAVGLDISSEMISVAKNKASAAGLDQIKFIHADWETVEPDLLKAYDFKIIFCANAFHYFKQPETATLKFHEQLGKDGTLYLLERNKSRSLLTFVWGVLHKVLIKDQVIFYKTSELLEICEKSGFSKVKVLRSINSYFWKNKLFTSIVLLQCK